MRGRGVRVTYTFPLVGVCPADKEPDSYEVTVTARRMIRVEEILASADRLVAKPLYGGPDGRSCPRTCSAGADGRDSLRRRDGVRGVMLLLTKAHPQTLRLR